MNTIKIGEKLVGENQPCFIVAEAGVNHNGSLELAKRLVDVATEAGADAVKFQLLTAKGLYVQDAGKFITEWGKEVDIFDIWKKTEVPDAWIPELVAYCQEKEIIFFSSVFEERAVDVLNPYVNAFKIGSSETTHIPLLKKVARTGRSVVFAIGEAEIDEVKEAVSTIREESNNDIAIMHCVAKYPTPLELANVQAVAALKGMFPDIVVGYSDHSLDPTQVPMAGRVKGAKILKKHFIISRGLEGIDHTRSLEPQELKQMVQAIRRAEEKVNAGKVPELSINPAIWGDGAIKLTEEQKMLLQFVRRKIFAMKDISQGEPFNEKNIAVLRPGNRKSENSLHPRDYFKLLRGRASRNISALEIISENDFEL